MQLYILPNGKIIYNNNHLYQSDLQRLLTQIDYDTLNNSALKLYYGVFTGDGKANYPYIRSFNIGLRPKVVILTLNAEQNAFGGLTWMAGVDITTEAIQITNKGFKTNRLRLHDNIARIEIPKNEFDKLLSQKENIITSLKNIGIKHITLDLEGFRSGSMDKN